MGEKVCRCFEPGVEPRRACPFGPHPSPLLVVNPIPRDSDFIPLWARSPQEERDRLRWQLRGRPIGHALRYALKPRDQKIVGQVRKGNTLAAVGLEFGICKERVRQIVARAERIDARRRQHPVNA